MPPEAGICIFIAIMTALSIPIIAILKHKPRNPQLEAKIQQLDQRLAQLELENSQKTIELESMRNEVKFTTRLLEHK
jgi:hypothetical protein